jgi:2,5-diketo-D-gluconate reductase A
MARSRVSSNPGVELNDAEMTRIAALDTGGTLFFDHADPAMVSSLNSRKAD